jgi:hypothetical protein
LAEGESFWLAGRAAPAETGSVVLATSDKLSVVVSDASILEVKKDDDLFLVRVKAGHSALVRFEAITTLEAPKAKCGCSETPAQPSTIARINSGGFGHSGAGIVINCFECRVEMQCEFYLYKGGLHRICVPYLVCEDVCTGTPT